MTAAEVRALRLENRRDEHLRAARDLVIDEPENVLAQIEAAYGCDYSGFEDEAIVHYDAAYRLGVPADERRRFLVGYGSTLRNVGRSDDAVGVLAQAVVDDPGYPAHAAFLALALFANGHPKAALATMLGCALDLAPTGAFDGYERALAEYHRELLA